MVNRRHERTILCRKFCRPLIGNENGAIFFNLDWQNQQADNRRQQINDLYTATIRYFTNSDESLNFQPNLIETTHDLEPEKLIETARENLFEPTKDREKFEQMRRQPETMRSEIRRTVEPQKKEVEVKNQPASANEFAFRRTSRADEKRRIIRAGICPNSAARRADGFSGAFPIERKFRPARMSANCSIKTRRKLWQIMKIKAKKRPQI